MKKMTRKQRFLDFLHFYKYANSQKDKFYNVKWRLLLGLLLIVVFYQVSQYLPTVYPNIPDNVITNIESQTAVFASERMMNWFLTGFFLGFLAFALMIEGEFILAVKNTRPLDKELDMAEHAIENVEKDLTRAVGLNSKKSQKHKRK